MATIDTLQNQVVDLQKTIEAIQSTVQNINSQIKNLTEAENFDVFVQNEISAYFGKETAENIIKRLKTCRIEGNNYQLFSPVYHWKSVRGNLKNRQLLKLISAVYRIKYLKKDGNVYALKSDLKYAKECPECGSIASSLYDRLVSEGLV
jgi:predicted RNA-binding Zn-ribbon protein involved in translation (DUF1610 family)